MMLEVRVFADDVVIRRYADEVGFEDGILHLFRIETMSSAIIETEVKLKHGERFAVRVV